MLSPCRFKSVLALKFIASRVLTALAQASFQPTGQKENAHLCPKSGPCGVRGWSNCLSPQSTQGPPADGAAWPPCGGAACRSLVCAVATQPSTERGPRGRPPATLLPPQSFTWICFPPQNLLALDLDVVQGLPAATVSATDGELQALRAGLGAGTQCDRTGVCAGLCGRKGHTSACCRSGGAGTAWPRPPVGPSWPLVAAVRLRPSVKQARTFPA